MKTLQQIESEVYGGPGAFDAILAQAKLLHLYDANNLVTMTAHEALVLLACRKELFTRDTLDQVLTGGGETNSVQADPE